MTRDFGCYHVIAMNGPEVTPSSALPIAADRLRDRLEAEKQGLGNVDFEWYPYNTLSNVEHLIKLFADHEQVVLEAAVSDGVIDLGCQDGDLAFLFESLGCQVTAVDNEATSHNGMRGVRALSWQLGSTVRLHKIDLDQPFTLPKKKYGLSIFLGTLYHLKNPFQVMEILARHSTYCVCSTRVMRRLPDSSEVRPDMPIAYLLDAFELNQDDTNYWILSEAALQRLLRRSGWDLFSYFTAGDREHSDPVSLDHDERAFCLLRSRYGFGHLRLMHGWYEPESTGWRWTKREFSIGLPQGHRQRISMRLFIPQPLLDRVGKVTLQATLDGTDLKPAVFDEPGEHDYIRPLNPPVDGEGEPVIHFQLDKVLPRGDPDPKRELGIIVASVELS